MSGILYYLCGFLKKNRITLNSYAVKYFARSTTLRHFWITGLTVDKNEILFPFWYLIWYFWTEYKFLFTGIEFNSFVPSWLNSFQRNHSKTIQIEYDSWCLYFCYFSDKNCYYFRLLCSFIGTAFSEAQPINPKMVNSN